MKKFDWHSDEITEDTVITVYYRNTQNARRFFKKSCGEQFRFDRSFMKWLKNNPESTMGDAANEWLLRQKRSK